MKALKFLLAASSLLVALSPLSASAQAVAEVRGERWLTRYYENPRPNDLLMAVHQLSRSGYFDREDNRATAIGFFATVFSQNPHRVRHWLSQTADLPVAHRRLLAAAAWQAGHPRGFELLRELASDASRESQIQIADLLQRGPQPLEHTVVQSESSLRVRWGAFLASGQSEHIVAMLAALGTDEPALTTAARYALAQSAAEHRYVFQICETQLAKQPAGVQSEIRAALSAAALDRPGA